MRLFLITLLLFAPLAASEEMVVHLRSEESLTPLYFAPIQERESGFAKPYLSSLEKVVAFDFNNNGKTRLSSDQKCKNRIEISIKNKIAQVKVQCEGVSKGVNNAALTGNLSQDRKVLHGVHDALFQALYHSKGVADTQLLYAVRNKKGNDPEKWTSALWLADYDGENARPLTEEGPLCVTPTFLPARGASRCQNFLYVSYKSGQPKIFAATLQESAGRRLTFLRGNQLMPAIAPKLNAIAFISDITGNPDLFIQDFSPEKGLLGKPRQVFCAPGATQGSPTFNPDGSQLAFVSNKDGTPRIYLLDIPPEGASLKTLKPRMLTKKNRENTSPSWSPDGTKIAYSALTSGIRQIWIYDFIQGEERQMTEGAGHKENPSWAPNSLHLVFNTQTENSSELYIVNLNQKKAVKITGGTGEKRFPAWEKL